METILKYLSMISLVLISTALLPFMMLGGTMMAVTPPGANNCFARSIKKVSISLKVDKEEVDTQSERVKLSRSSFVSVSKKPVTLYGGLAIRTLKLLSLIFSCSTRASP